jgi:hypothetical protein
VEKNQPVYKEIKKTGQLMRKLYKILIFLIIISCEKDIEYSEEQLKHIDKYEELTNLIFPLKSEIIQSFDSPGFAIVFKTDKTFIDQYLDSRAPFGINWEEGPVPIEYCYGISFGPGYNIDGHGKGEIFGDQKLIDLLSSNTVYYSAKGSFIGPDRSEVIDIIVLDVAASTVWYSHNKWY